MTALLSAIVTYFSAAGSGPLSNTITGGIHLEQAADGTALPYCVVNVIGNPADSHYTSVSFTEPMLQFTIRGIGGAATLALLNSLVTAFDAMSLSGGPFHLCRTTGPVAVGAPEDDEQGRDVYGWAVTYSYATT